MTVSALVTRNDITATASQTSFTYTFRVLEATDMDVYQNGALLASGYTVNDVGVNTGGTVTLSVGVPVGQIVSLVLAMPLDRTTNYQNSGDFLAGDVNGDFDKIYIGAIQNENEGGRSLRLKDVEPPTAGVDMTIPLKADRLGKLLSFNSVTGAPEASTLSVLYDSAAWTPYNFTGDGSTVAFTLGSTPNSENNTQVYIDGVYQQKDGYTVSGAVLTFSVAPPNLSTIEVMVTTAMAVGATSSDLVSYTPAGTGAVATTVQTKLRESVSVKDFGAVGDGVTDDTLAFQKAVISGASQVLIPTGTYLCDKININPYVHILGEGREGSIVKFKSGATSLSLFQFLNATGPISQNKYANRISNLTLLGTVATDGFDEFRHLILCQGVSHFSLDNCILRGFQGDGLSIRNGTIEAENFNVIVTNCLFDGLNKDNRNAISITGAVHTVIENNFFVNTTRSNMPGAIDVEPNPSYTFAEINSIVIRDNYFSNIGGNVAAVACYIPIDSQDFTVEHPKNITIANNVFETVYRGVYVGQSQDNDITNSNPQFNLIVNNNKVHNASDRAFWLFGIKGAILNGNSFEDCANASRIGWIAAPPLYRNVKDIQLLNNLFRKNGTADGYGVLVYNGERIYFYNNTFEDVGLSAGGFGVPVHFGAGTNNNVRLVDNTIINSLGRTTGAVSKSGGVTVNYDTSILQMNNYAGLTDAATISPMWYSGVGTPESAITANIGSMYVNTTGGAATTLYVKESGTGNTGWVGK
jgi:hypothetical protein